MEKAKRAFGASDTLYRYLAILACSTMGQWMMRVGLGWTAWEVTQSAFWTGMISSLTMLPSLILMPLFGVWADRIPLRRAIPVIVGAFFVISLTLATLLQLGLFGLPVLLTMSAAFGLGSATYHPFRVTVPARIDVDIPLPRIIGMTAIVFNASGIVGPAVAGVLLAAFGAAAVFAVAAVLFALHVVTFHTMQLKARKERPGRKGFVTELISGVVIAIRMPELITAAGIVMMVGAVARAALEMLPAVTGRILNGGAEDYAGLVAASGLGAIMAGLGMSLMATEKERIRLRIFVAAAMAMLIAGALGMMRSYLGLLAPCPFLEFIVTMVGASTQSLVQITVDDDYRGRVLSLWTMAAFGGPAVGVLGLGAVGEAIGLGRALMLFGGVGFAAVLLAAGFDVHVRRRR